MKKPTTLFLCTCMLLTILFSCKAGNTDRGNAKTSVENTNIDSNQTVDRIGVDNNQTTDRMSANILKIFDGGTYHMKLKGMSGSMEGMEIEMYVKNGMTVMLMQIKDKDIRYVMKNSKNYIIMDDQKLIILADIFSDDDIPAFGNTSGLIYVGEGSGRFNGKTYKYDEYTNQNGELSFLYMDGGSLKGMRTVKGEANEDVEMLAFDNNVPDNVFNIPTDYQVVDGSGNPIDLPNTPVETKQPTPKQTESTAKPSKHITKPKLPNYAFLEGNLTGKDWYRGESSLTWTDYTGKKQSTAGGRVFVFNGNGTFIHIRAYILSPGGNGFTFKMGNYKVDDGVIYCTNVKTSWIDIANYKRPNDRSFYDRKDPDCFMMYYFYKSGGSYDISINESDLIWGEFKPDAPFYNYGREADHPLVSLTDYLK